MTAIRAPLDRSAVTGEIIAQFRVALRDLRCIGSQRMLQRGISMSHLHVMSLLERHGELPMSRVAELLDVSDSNATGIVDRMEERGVVERVRAIGDRRLVLVRVTDGGRQALADLEGLRDEMLGRVLGKLDDRQLGRFVAALADLRTAANAVAAEEPDLFRHDLASHERAGAGHARHVQTD